MAAQAQVGKIQWSSEEYTLERFVDLYRLPQIVRIKTNPRGNDERNGQSAKEPSNKVFVLHSVKHKEVIRATDSLKNEFYLPHDSTAKVEVLWKDYKKFYDNVEELANDFPAHVLVVEEDEDLGIKKGDVLKLKRKIKIREKNYLKCSFLAADRSDVDIPFAYKGVLKTLGDLTSENIPLKEAVEFCRLPRKVKFIDDKLKIKRIAGTSKCPTLLSSLEHVTLHEVLDHIDVIVGQLSGGQVVVSSIPLVDDVIVYAATAESRGNPDYTRHCQSIGKGITPEMVKDIGILHQNWFVFQGDGDKDPSSWNQQFCNLPSLEHRGIPHVEDENPSIQIRHESIPEDENAPRLPPKMLSPVSKKKEPLPPIPPRVPLHPRMGQGRRTVTPPTRRRAVSEPDEHVSFASDAAMKSRTLPRVLPPTQPTDSDEGYYAGIRFAAPQNKKDMPSAAYRNETGKQAVEKIIKDRFGTSDALEGKDGYVKMDCWVSHLQSKYDRLVESIHRQAGQETHGTLLHPDDVTTPELRERSSSHLIPETRAKLQNKDHTKIQKRRSDGYEGESSQVPGQSSTFPRRKSNQSESEFMANTMSDDLSGGPHLKIRFEEPSQKNELYSEVPSLLVPSADRCNQLPMLKHPQKAPKAPPGLDFINNKLVRDWNPNEVLQFLKFINLEKCTKVFKQKKIDGEMLVKLDKKGLNELHIAHKHASTIVKLVHECITHENATVPNKYVQQY